MSILNQKNILLAVSGGIAAYKSSFLVRLLIKEGANVKVILTESALEFVTPLTLSTLSKNTVEWKLSKENGDWNNHVDLGLWADLMIIAPTTANTLAKMADGTCDNLVLASYLSAKCPVYFAPAMDLDMYKHPTTKQNIEQLIQNNNVLIPARAGELASGLQGEGRMAEPEEIVDLIKSNLLKNLPLVNKKVVVTAGPTYEKIDPVRYIGNFSSGKMGFEIAKEAAKLGANVSLISGPSNQTVQHKAIQRFDVESAREMRKIAEKEFQDCNIMIMSAAVADYRPKNIAKQKIKKQSDTLTIELEKNPDILKGLGKKKNSQFLVGFALETNDEMEYALKKIEQKNLDMIVLNSLKDLEAGFQKDTNKIKIIYSRQEIEEYPVKSKQEVAKDIFTSILNKI